MTGLLLGAVAGPVAAAERPIEELPKDVMRLVFAWTEPIKQVAKRSRQFDPVSGLWFGLLDGSIKSVERTTQFFLQDNASSSTPQGSNPLLRYSF